MDYVTLQECICQQSVHGQSMDKDDDNITQKNSSDQWTLLEKINGVFTVPI